MDKKLKLAVIGSPIKHSKSPQIHKSFALQKGIEIDFSKEEVKPEELSNWLDNFFTSGGTGLSITLPLKELAINYADDVTERAKLASSANVLYKKDLKIIADNTDGHGLVIDLVKNKEFQIRDKKLLILGSGGATRGLLPSLLKEEPHSITIANRTERKAEKIVADLNSKENFTFNSNLITGGLTDTFLSSSEYDLILNATSASIDRNNSLKLPKKIFSGCSLALDLYYSEEKSAFLEDALSGGANTAVDGYGMLVEQGAESFRLWTNLIPDTSRLLI